MRITSKGQVTIPQEVREKFGLLPDTEVDFVVKRNSIHLVKADNPKKMTRGELIVSRMRGRAKGGMSTDEILALTRK
ncbi:MAG TPA: AbrB/MazE/SpoVT family DNA-binding domain-containing protein [Thermoanaerobaculia bacterium]|jgi:AbrB family looped-hinge helix DNA binding protein|nr:AbrB/MazE/SpoVT family DNA-binding domain-containing protein [Thermoanaerobaculia bacterium]